MVPKYGHYVAYARAPGRIHRAVPPTKTDKLPSGSQWLHEMKHDGFRIHCRRRRTGGAPAAR